MAYLDSNIATASRRDIYADVTARVIAQLEAGTAPWACPWDKVRGDISTSLPHNGRTGRAYSGVNILLLWLAASDAPYPSNDWLTYKQAAEIGAHVRKGERGTHIVYADSFVPKGEAARAARDGDDPRKTFFLKSYCVFNVAQLDGWTDQREPLPERDREPHELGEALIAASGAEIRIGGHEAYYSPSGDFIQIPEQIRFRDQINYYRTAAHELAHWTGHKSRLDRRLVNAFGSKDYAREELVAEMGAAFLCASLGIAPTVRHADYLGSWLKVLREDNRAIFKAATLASRASDFLLSKVA